MTMGPGDLVQRGEAALKKGYWEDAKALLSKALDMLDGKVEDHEGRKLLARALRYKAYAETRLGESATAVVNAKRAMEISASIGDLEGEADAYRRLGYIHWQSGDLSMAHEFYRSALEKAERTGAKALLGKTMIEVGNTYNSNKEFTEAQEHYRRAIEILREAQEHSEVGRAFNNLGSSLMGQGRYEEALDALQQSKDTADLSGDLTHKGWASFNMGECLTRMDRPEEAKVQLDEAIVLLESTEDFMGLATIQLVYGILYTSTGEFDEAEASFTRSFEIIREHPLPALEGEVHMYLGKLLIEKGEREKAREHLERARDIFKETGIDSFAKDADDILKGL